ncbi:hypothetical protein [Streptomyces sp. NPDC057580]
MPNPRRRQLKRLAPVFVRGLLAGAGKAVGGAIAVAVLAHLHGFLR